MDTKETFVKIVKKKKSLFLKNVKWKPQTFNSPCQTENDRIIKISKREEASLNATK